MPFLQSFRHRQDQKCKLGNNCTVVLEEEEEEEVDRRNRLWEKRRLATHYSFPGLPKELPIATC
jgi:hypothetical protein